MHIRYDGTCGTSQLVAAVGTVSVAVTHPGVDDASSRATVEAVGGTSRGARGHSVRCNTTYKGGDSSLTTEDGWGVDSSIETTITAS